MKQRWTRDGESGQVLVIFAVSLTLLIGIVALVIDVSWHRSNILRVQRAADAAALAGVINLPGDPAGANAAAYSEATKNGYTNGVGGVQVTPTRDPSNRFRLNVRVTAPVRTFFMGFFGLTTVTASRQAWAEFTPPVPMGSPQSYYGVDEIRCAVAGGCSNRVPNPGAGGGTLDPQGFWGAVNTLGSARELGDAYSAANNPPSGANPDFDPAGYNYTVELGAGTTNGKVWIFDPTFCAVGATAQGVRYGAGDHWSSGPYNAVTTYYKLWNTRNTPYDESDDTLVTQSGTLFENERQTDQTKVSGTYLYGTPQLTTDVPNCGDTALERYHHRWWLMAQNLPAGVYRVQVTTNSPSNASIVAKNLFSIQAEANNGALARVHGAGRMCAYNSLPAGTSRFYLAQIAAVYAGKTMVIRLFDPGDVAGDAYLRILKPGTDAYSYATFSYTADNGKSGTNVTQLQTAIGGVRQFNNSWITIRIDLPATYGVAPDDLTPAGETQPGWWKVEYQLSGGFDTTTWRVGIEGSPVHLTPP